MNIQIFGKSKCFDTKKAERFFKERRVKFQKVDLLQKSLSKGELNSVISAVGGGIDNLIDENAKDALMIIYLAYDEDKFDKLLETPSALKTPIVRNGKKATVGFEPEIWQSWIDDEN